jgi:hypothetical protein
LPRAGGSCPPFRTCAAALVAVAYVAAALPALADKADRADISVLLQDFATFDGSASEASLHVPLADQSLGSVPWSDLAARDMTAMPAGVRGEPFGNDWTFAGIYHWWVDPHLLPRGNVEPIDFSRYGAATLGEQLYVVWPETLMILGGLTVKGFVTWNWGPSGFRFNSEGWFDRGSMGMDKLGHAYSTYMITELITDRVKYKALDPNGAALAAAAVAMTTMLYVEVFDGFSGDHGFSYEDLIADAAGAGLSILRSAVPGLQEKLDFRLEYIPSGNESGFHPITDYSGQKYVLALKLAGFEALRDTPLRFVELQAGYFARGFTQKEKAAGDPVTRDPYVAIGINLQELLFGWPSVRDTDYGRAGRRIFEYAQVPYTYIATDNSY